MRLLIFKQNLNIRKSFTGGVERIKMHSKSFPLSHQRLALCISVVFLIKLSAFFVDGQPRFTQEPPSYLYVLSGENATFNWEYFVVDRETAFDPLSPKWGFYDENGTEHVIGNDFKFDSWNWKTDLKTCPKRLLNPTLRVFRKENATLVITKVTTADNGMYRCTLVLKSPPPVKSKIVQLIVTVNPQIKITGKTEVIEHANLTLNSSAVGSPTPNVTWINNANGVLAQGIQSAVLIITNITRKQAGIYKCIATNNPNEYPVQNVTTVAVKFPPELNINHAIDYVQTCPDKKVEISCGANGYPDPTYYWYNPFNVSVGENKTGAESKIKVDPVQGNWTCHITNGVGQDIHFKVQMTVLPKDHKDCEP